MRENDASGQGSRRPDAGIGPGASVSCDGGLHESADAANPPPNCCAHCYADDSPNPRSDGCAHCLAGSYRNGDALCNADLCACAYADAHNLADTIPNSHTDSDTHSLADGNGSAHPLADLHAYACSDTHSCSDSDSDAGAFPGGEGTRRAVATATVVRRAAVPARRRAHRRGVAEGR